MHVIECPEGQQHQDQTGRLIILQENPGSSSLSSPAEAGRAQAPRGSAGPLHCTHLQFCPAALEHGTIPFTMESGPSNFCCVCSARSVSVELSCGQTRVQIHQLVGHEAEREPSLKPVVSLPSSAGARLNPFFLPWNLQWAL